MSIVENLDMINILDEDGTYCSLFFFFVLVCLFVFCFYREFRFYPYGKEMIMIKPGVMTNAVTITYCMLICI